MTRLTEREIAIANHCCSNGCDWRCPLYGQDDCMDELDAANREADDEV